MHAYWKPIELSNDVACSNCGERMTADLAARYYHCPKCHAKIGEPVEETEHNEYDPVQRPKHYNQGGIECIDALKAATTGLHGIEAVCTANAIKYLWRWKHKNGIQDIDKAIWYLERLKKELSNDEE